MHCISPRCVPISPLSVCISLLIACISRAFAPILFCKSCVCIHFVHQNFQQPAHVKWTRRSRSAMMMCGTGWDRGGNLTEGREMSYAAPATPNTPSGFGCGEMSSCMGCPAWCCPGPWVPLNLHYYPPAPAHLGSPCCVPGNKFHSLAIWGNGGFAPYTPDPNPVNFSTEAEGFETRS